MKRSALRWVAPALAGLGAGACGGEPVAALMPLVPGPAPAAAGPAYPSPARWDYHPSPPERSIARHRQPDGSCIVIAEGGQRWKVSPPGSRGAAARECSGPAVASGTLAPEELGGVVRLGATSWMFVGVSGTLYPAADALGSLTKAIAPPEAFGKVVGGAKGIVAVAVDGRLFRWEESRGWRAISGEGWPELPGTGTGAGAGAGAGTGGVHLPRVLDLAANHEGLLALAFPEALFVSTDLGQTWRGLGAPTIGAQRAGTVLDGRLAAEGIYESIVWAPEQTPSYSRVREPLDDRAELAVSVGRGPSAGAVVGGRAAIDADRYYEAVAPSGAKKPWVLASGRIEGRLSERPIPNSSDCEAIRVGAAGKHLLIVCERSGAEVQELRRSDDAGATWSEPLVLSAPDAEFVSVAVAANGDALAAGMCKPPASGESCKATAPLLVRLQGRRLEVVVAAAAELNGTAMAPAFSANGLMAYFLGRRAKDDRLALFVSQDGGLSFAQRSLDPPSNKPKPETAREPEGESDEDEPGADDMSLADASAIRPGDDGTVGIVLRRAQGLAYVTTDENGKVQYIATAPAEEAEPVLAGHGNHVLAASVEASGVVVWESRNGGATWTELPSSIAVIQEVVQGNMPIACSSHGCLLGETVSRLGWGGQSEPPGPEVPDEPAPKEIPAVRTPIACELEASSRWVRIEHAHPPDFRAAPQVEEAMRGRSVWSVVSWDKRSGALSVVSAMLPPSGEGEARVVTRSLLARPPAGSLAAVDLIPQMEGYAVGRVRWPEAGKPEGPMRDVEVAWENWMDGTSGRVKIADAGVFERDSIDITGDVPRLQTALLSVSPGGIFVRPQSPRSSSALAMFVRPRGEPDRFDFPRFPERSWGKQIDVRYELAMAGGQPIGVGIVRQGAASSEYVYLLAQRPRSTAATAAPSSGAWEVQAVALAPTTIDRKLLFDSGWTYSGTTLGVTSFFSDPARSQSWAYFQPFRAGGTLGPAEALPTLLDTGNEPRPCKPGERTSTAHFEAAFSVRNRATSAGTRHPVLITEAPTTKGATPSAPFELITGGAVLHGTPAAPCVAAWDARGVGKLQMTAILSGDLAHSWVFRPAASTESAAEPAVSGSSPEAQKKPAGPKPFALEYRPMSCRFDRLAKIPESVWAEPATSRFER